MDKALKEFCTRLDRILMLGNDKYSNSYLQANQLEFIKEKLSRLEGATDKDKKYEDCVKVAAYAYLYSKKLEKLYNGSSILGLSSFSGLTAKQLFSEGLITSWIHHKDILDQTEFLDSEYYTGFEECILLGYKFKIPPIMIKHFNGHIYNLHPGTLPLFPGKDPHIQALKLNQTLTHVTIHHVTEGYDTGSVIAQMPVFILKTDNEKSLLNRLKECGLNLSREFLKQRRMAKCQ